MWRWDDLLDTIARFRTECRPVLTAAPESMAAARPELTALADEGVTSRPPRRSLREAEGELERLTEGRTSAERRVDVASRGRRPHAETEDIRRRIRGAWPRLALLRSGVAAEAAVGP